MLLCNRTGFAFKTTKMSAGKNSSALAGPDEPCFNRVKMFRQLRTMQSSFSCGDGYESIDINSTNVHKLLFEWKNLNEMRSLTIYRAIN